MRSTMTRWAMAAVLGMLATVRAEAGLVVAPNAYASTPGNFDNRFPFLVSGGLRYQQVFAASQFTAFGGPQLISEIDFRSGNFVNEAFTATIADIGISLSTTQAAPDALSSTFASNIGSDVTQVYSGSLTLSSTNAVTTGGTHVFDIAIHFQTPFLYNPAAGNLLLDVNNVSGADSNVGNEFFDAVDLTGDPTSRDSSVAGMPGQATGFTDSAGLITQFQFGNAVATPEPATLLPLAAGALGTGWFGWRRSRRRSA